VTNGRKLPTLLSSDSKLEAALDVSPEEFSKSADSLPLLLEDDVFLWEGVGNGFSIGSIEVDLEHASGTKLGLEKLES